MFDLGLVLLKIINNEKYLHRIHKIARKKKCISFKKFFFLSHPEKPHGHKKKRPSHCSSVECASRKPAAGTIPHLEEHVQRYLTGSFQTGPSTPGEGLKVKRSDFCNEHFRFQEATCFSSPDSFNSGMDNVAPGHDGVRSAACNESWNWTSPDSERQARHLSSHL